MRHKKMGKDWNCVITHATYRTCITSRKATDRAALPACVDSSVFFFISRHIQKQLLHPRPCPWCFAQKLQAGFDAGVAGEAVDVY